MAEQLRSFQAEIADKKAGARTPSFREFKLCGVPDFFGVKVPNVVGSLQMWDLCPAYRGTERETGGRRLPER